MYATPTSGRTASSADKVDNARAVLADYRAVGEKLWERFNAGRKEQLWYYHSLVVAFREAGATGCLFEELDRTVSEIEGLAAEEAVGAK